MVYINELLILLQLVAYQFRLVVFYWAAGLLIGSVISVYADDRLKGMVLKLNSGKRQLLSLTAAAALGAASPICMYGTVPLIVSLGKEKMPQQLLVSFMVSSILINPSLFIFSFTLGAPLAIARLLVSIGLGIISGLLVKLLYSKRSFFQFEGFKGSKKVCSKAKTFKSFLNDLNRAISITAPYLLIGILLTALFGRYFPQELILDLFGGNRGLGVLLSASLGVPIYVCGGGTIPLLKAWLLAGMTPGSAIAFMITGPATKLTNLSAVKTILGIRNFILYIVFNITFAVICGLLTDVIVNVFG